MCIACHHVDDVAATASCDHLAFELRDELKRKFGISDAGELTWHLGMHIDIKPGVYAHISQRTYIESILRRFDMVGCKVAKTPMSDTYRVSTDDCPETVNEVDRQLYMEMVGCVLYAGYMTRCDIGYACSQLGGVLQNPGPSHLRAARRVLRYLAGTIDYGLLYRFGSWSPPGFDHPIKASVAATFTDADWAGCRDDRKSTLCHLTFLAGGPVSWRMTKQQQKSGTAMSSCESELIAMSGGARDIQYLRNTFATLGILVQTKATILMSDSSAAISIADSSGMKEKTKHIALRYFQIRGLQKEGIVKVAKIGTDLNPSDIGTKALGSITFARHRDVVVQRVPFGDSVPKPRSTTIETEKVLAALVGIASNVASGEWTTVSRRMK
jgi:hypothetical protein